MEVGSEGREFCCQETVVLSFCQPLKGIWRFGRVSGSFCYGAREVVSGKQGMA